MNYFSYRWWWRRRSYRLRWSRRGCKWWWWYFNFRRKERHWNRCLGSQYWHCWYIKQRW